MIKYLLFLIVLIPSLAAAQSSVKIWDGADTAGVTSNALDVNPIGGSTSANQTTQLGYLDYWDSVYFPSWDTYLQDIDDGVRAMPTGGYTKYTFGGLVGTVQTVKGTAATLGGYYLFNGAATVCYLQVFDAATATAITLGTTVPDLSFGIPAGAAANIPAVRPGISFSSGIKIASTTTRAGSTPCGTGTDVNIWYK